VKEKYKLITPEKLFTFWIVLATTFICLASKTHCQPQIHNLKNGEHNSALTSLIILMSIQLLVEVVISLKKTGARLR
jgi:hypothetical protein